MNASAAILLASFFACPMERVSTMDPALSRSAYDARAIKLVYETPLDIDYAARPYRLVPGCCELPEISADGLTYRLRLRTGTTAFVPQAADVVRALERLRDPEIVSPNGWMMTDVDTVRAADDRTVEIRLRCPVRYFPWLLAQCGCAVRGPDGEGSGPFALMRWRRNHDMVFSRRPGSRGANSRGFDTVRYLLVDDMSTQWLMFLKGELDFLGEIARDNWDSVVRADGTLDPGLAARGIRLHSMPALEVAYAGMNMRDPVLGPNRKLRQALNCAFDYPEWERFNNGRVLPCDGPVPPGVADRLETPFAYAFDLAKARRLMAEAGYPGGLDPKTGRRLVLTLALGQAKQEARESGELMAAFYEKIGVKLELESMTWNAFLSAVNDGRVQLYRMVWVGDYPDAQNFLQLFYGPNRSPGVNHSNYANAEYDAAYERGDYAKCQEIVREDCPWIFTNFNRRYALTGPRLGNYVPSDFPYGVEQFYENTVP